MGASSWYYFVPYQEDVSHALQNLRQQVFEEGDYLSLWEQTRSMIEAGRDAYHLFHQGQDYDTVERRFRALEDEWERGPKQPPQTIEELLKRNDAQGTHTILDITRVSSVPAFGAMTSLEKQVMLRLFGTDRPTREMIEAMIAGSTLWATLQRGWSARYCIVYRNAVPHELFFFGISGD